MPALSGHLHYIGSAIPGQARNDNERLLFLFARGRHEWAATASFGGADGTGFLTHDYGIPEVKALQHLDVHAVVHTDGDGVGDQFTVQVYPDFVAVLFRRAVCPFLCAFLRGSWESACGRIWRWRQSFGLCKGGAASRVEL